jgi:hypothetical protein
MQELPTPSDNDIQLARTTVFSIMDRHLDAAFVDLDRFHRTTGIPDEEIISALRDGGYDDEADMFVEWLAEGDDPERDYREKPDPEGPGGYVTDPPSESYAELEKQLNEQRKATGITYEWTERERMIYSCRATMNRSQLQTWLNANVDSIVTPDDVDAETIVEFLEANPGASIDERRWPADHSETDCLDLRVVDNDWPDKPEGGYTVSPAEQP